MMRKGSMTVNKLITIILATVVLVMLTTSLWGKGFGPLSENIKGRADEVLILLGIREGGVPVCGDSFEQTIENVGRGMFFPCENNCTFELVSPGSLLKISKFAVTKDRGAVAWFEDDNAWKSERTFSVKSVESERHRAAYLALVGVADKFFEANKGDGESKDEFFKGMDFDPNGFLQYTLDGVGDVVFRWDGTRWTRSGVFDSYPEEDEVFEEIYEWYKDGDDMSWNHMRDEKENLPISNLDIALASKKEFRKWFDNSKLKGASLMEGSGGKFYIETEDFLFNHLYWFSEGRWSVTRTGISGDPITENEVFERVYSEYAEGDAVTWAMEPSSGHRYLAVSNLDLDSVRGIAGEEEFRRWFNKLKKNWEDKSRSQKELLRKWSEFLKGDVGVNFMGKNYKLVLSRKLFGARSIPVIHFSLSNGELFGLYYEGGVPSLAYGYGDSFGESAVNDFLRLSDNDWAEFIKINKIYEYFRSRRCGV